MKRPWNGRRGQGQNIHAAFQILDFLLMPDPEPLLLVHHQQSQVLKPHVFGKDSVGADQDIHRARGGAPDGFRDFFLASKTGKEADLNRIIPHPGAEGVVMLLGQDRGRGEDGHLFTVLYRLKGRPDGDFRLAVSHVAADQPVHDPGALHVPFRILDGRDLIIRLLVGKHLLKLLLPNRVRREGEALPRLSFGVQFHQILRQTSHGFFDLVLRPLPFLAPQAVDPGFGVFASHIALQKIQGGGRHV